MTVFYTYNKIHSTATLPDIKELPPHYDNGVTTQYYKIKNCRINLKLQRDSTDHTHNDMMATLLILSNEETLFGFDCK